MQSLGVAIYNLRQIWGFAKRFSAQAGSGMKASQGLVELPLFSSRRRMLCAMHTPGGRIVKRVR